MSYEEIGKLMDQWNNDPTFRNALRKDPEGTIRKSGVALSPEEWKAFKNFDWALSDEELAHRANKAVV